jgi:hypothetical protein
LERFRFNSSHEVGEGDEAHLTVPSERRGMVWSGDAMAGKVRCVARSSHRTEKKKKKTNEGRGRRWRRKGGRKARVSRAHPRWGLKEEVSGSRLITDDFHRARGEGKEHSGLRSTLTTYWKRKYMVKIGFCIA